MKDEKQFVNEFDRITNITELKEEAINKINVFLAENQNKQFCTETLKAIAELNEIDILGLRHQCNYIRGDFIEFDVDHTYFGLNENGLNLRQILNDYKSSLNKDDYDDEEYKTLLKEYMDETQATLSKFGVVLETSSGTKTEILMLNDKYEPIFNTFVNFDY